MTLVWWLSALLLLAVVVAFGYFGYAFARYHRVRHEDRPCGDADRAVRVGEFDLYVRELGTSSAEPPVIVLHGGPGHSSLSFKDGLDFLAADRRVVLYDQRGSGLSEVRSGAAHYDADRLVDEIDAVRRDLLGVDRFVLIAHSAGGALAQRYLVRYGQHVDRLVLVASTTANNNLRPAIVWRTLGPGLYATAMGLPPRGADAADAWFGSSQLSGDTRRLYDRTRTDVISDSGPITFATWFAVSQSLAGRGLDAEIADVDIPTLVVYGSADSRYTGQETADLLARVIPGARTARIERAGHWPFLENPEAFRSAVLSFLGP